MVLVGLFYFGGGIHGLALSIHRVWQSLGYKMWTWLAWIITFNFVNIAWVFFRAKEWDDAIKVLSGMFGFNGIILPLILENKLTFFSKYGIKFGGPFVNIDGNLHLIFCLLFAFILVVSFKNSIEQIQVFKTTFKTYLFSSFLFVLSVLTFNKVSEFLYFNF